MFNSLQQKISGVLDGLRSQGILSPQLIEKSIGEIRTALLEADVALEVVDSFISNVSKKAEGQELIKSVSPGQLLTKFVYDELCTMLSSSETESQLHLSGGNSPYFIMMVGLQGSGKTTTSAKLASFLKKKQGKKVLVASLDVMRPGAQLQLGVLASEIGVDSLEIVQGQMPRDIAKRAMDMGKFGGYDVVILDTAGRLHIDEGLMAEVSAVRKIVNPSEVLLVSDSMLGQESVKIAKAFNDAVAITGIVLTRVDGDSRGGSALSMRYVTGKPIKFMGVGEKTDALEAFDAKRVAGRILDRGDIVGLVEKAQEVSDEEENKRIAERMMKGKFDLNDLRKQLTQMRKMGGLSGIASMLPGLGNFKNQMKDAGIDDGILKRQQAIIDSMTAKERADPDILHASRKRRIAIGSGTEVAEINRLIKQYMTMSKVMKQVGKTGKMPQMPQMNGFRFRR